MHKLLHLLDSKTGKIFLFFKNLRSMWYISISIACWNFKSLKSGWNHESCCFWKDCNCFIKPHKWVILVMCILSLYCIPISYSYLHSYDGLFWCCPSVSFIIKFISIGSYFANNKISDILLAAIFLSLFP